MNINITILWQSIFFLVFVWTCYRFIWPVLINAMRERQETIAQGLENAEKASRDVELADQKAAETLQQARSEAQQIIDQARGQASGMIEDARTEARAEGERLKSAALAEVDQEVNRVREQLRTEVAALAVSGAERILETEIDRDKHGEMLNKLATEL